MTSDLSSDQVVLGPGIEVMVFLDFEVLVNSGEREKLGAVVGAEGSRPVVSRPSPRA